MRAKDADAQGKDVRKLRIRLFQNDAKLQLAEEEEEKPGFQISVNCCWLLEFLIELARYRDFLPLVVTAKAF